MEQMLDVHTVLIESRIENLEKVLRLFSERHVKGHDTIQAQSLVSHITCSLNNEKSRYEGLLHLQAFLPQCSNDILLESGIPWMISCIKACQNEELSVKNLSYITLASLMKSMSALPQVNKMISNNNISKLIDSIVGQQATLSTVYCLEVCLKMYPGICCSSKSKIEKFLLEFLQDDDVRKVKLSAKCYHLLLQVGASGMKGVTHRVAWEQQYRMIIGSLHTLLDLLYSNVMESIIKPDDEPTFNFPLSDLPTNPILQMMELSKKFSNLCYLLQVMLTEPFPVLKRVQPDLVVRLINRGLGVTGLSLGRVSTDNQILIGFLPAIHISLHRTLDALLFCLGDNALFYAEKVCTIICRSIKWTGQANCGISGYHHRNIRLSAYETLYRWLRISNSCSGIEFHMEDFVMNMMNDIIPDNSILSIREENDISKTGGKEKVVNKAVETRNKTGLNLTDGSEKLCCLALRCLRTMLFSSGMFLKSDIHKIFQTSAANLLLKIQRGQPSKTLYSISDCRRVLYDVFIALVLNPCSTMPPPTHMAIQIFSRGQVDSDQQIKHNCADTLRVLKKIIHTHSGNKNRMRNYVRNETGYAVESNLVRHGNIIENADMNIDNKLFIGLNSHNIKQAEIISSQESDKRALEHLDSKCDSDCLLKEDKNSGLLKDQTRKSSKKEFICLPEDIPTKRIKLQKDDENNIPLQQIDASIQPYETPNIGKMEDVPPIENTIPQNESNVAILQTDNFAACAENRDIQDLYMPSGNAENAANMTIDDMLSSFVDEPNEIL